MAPLPKQSVERSLGLRSLRWYQEEGLSKFRGKPSAFFAMEMRLGKTLTAIRWIQTQDVGFVLIIAPKTVLSAWEMELENEGLEYLNLTTLQGGVAIRAAQIENPKIPNVKYMLLNSECICRMGGVKFACDAIIFDEITEIKNPKSKITKICLKWCKRAKVTCGLAGQPAPESWEEMWTQMAFAYHGEWMGFSNFWKWRNAFFSVRGFDWVVKKEKVEVIRQAFHRDAYVMTRKDAGLANEKIYQKIIGELNEEERSIYKHAHKTWSLPNGEETKYAMVVAGWSRRITSGIMISGEVCWKYDALINLLQTNLKDNQVIVWCTYKHEIYLLWGMLKKKLGMSVTWISGASSFQERKERIRLFQANKRQIMLIQVDCGKFGIDLSAADTAIYFSSPWSYLKRIQSEDRIFAVGKTSSLLVIDLVTKNTIDEVVMESIKCKNSSARFLMERLNITSPPIGKER